jgi:hypothetical protein
LTLNPSGSIINPPSLALRKGMSSEPFFGATVNILAAISLLAL